MLKTKTKITICLAGVVSFVTAILSCLFLPGTSATNCTTSPCNTTFQIDVKEVLSVSITSPTTYASGGVGTLLTEQVGVSVTSNNNSGFVAGIRASNSAATLVGNNGGTLTNLSSQVASANFPSGKWGYSLNTSTYNPLPAYDGTPSVLFSSSTAGTQSTNVNFAAKAGYDNPSGTYTGTVSISVVSGGVSPDPGPTPVGPDDPGNTPTYHSTQGVTTYTTKTSTSSTSTTTTEVSNGDNTTKYTAPQGETQTTAAQNKSSLPVILAVTSAVSAAAGLGFFIIAKRREEEDDEEDELV